MYKIVDTINNISQTVADDALVAIAPMLFLRRGAHDIIESLDDYTIDGLINELRERTFSVTHIGGKATSGERLQQLMRKLYNGEKLTYAEREDYRDLFYREEYSSGLQGD